MQFLEDMAAQGEMPKSLERRPVKPVHLMMFWNAFADLRSCRPAGFGAAPIPWTAIDAWGQRYGLTGDAFERFSRIIAAMDSAWLKHITSKQTG